MDATNYLINEILDHITDIGAWTAPSTLYLALLKSASAASDDTTVNAGKEILSPGTDNYNRQVVTFAAETGQMTITTDAQTFGPATGTNWPEATHCWIVDNLAINTGNILFHGALTASKIVIVSASLIFAIGEVEISAS